MSMKRIKGPVTLEGRHYRGIGTSLQYKNRHGLIKMAAIVGEDAETLRDIWKVLQRADFGLKDIDLSIAQDIVIGSPEKIEK